MHEARGGMVETSSTVSVGDGSCLAGNLEIHELQLVLLVATDDTAAAVNEGEIEAVADMFLHERPYGIRCVDTNELLAELGVGVFRPLHGPPNLFRFVRFAMKVVHGLGTVLTHCCKKCHYTHLATCNMPFYRRKRHGYSPVRTIRWRSYQRALRHIFRRAR